MTEQDKPRIKYDAFAKDLARKCGDDVAAAIRRTMALHPDLDGKVAIAIMAAGVANAAAAGVFCQYTNINDPERMADALIEITKPFTISAIADLKGPTT